MNKTGIDYLDLTWNPIAMKCTRVSEACVHCWHLTRAAMLANNPIIPKERQEAYKGGSPVLIYDELRAPQRRRKPAKIGVQFMGDLFHEKIRAMRIRKVFDQMVWAYQHTFLVLTKRVTRMESLINCSAVCSRNPKFRPNVWLGVTAENQKRADERIPVLSEIPARVRFLSLEPLLEPIGLRPHLDSQGINWVIIGAETGAGLRRPPNQIDIEEMLMDCEEFGAAIWMKDNLRPYWDGELIQEWPK